MRSEIVFVSVIRDMAMYNRLVRDNPFNRGGQFVALDNREENASITSRYNSFLDTWDYSRHAWFVFLHEDYEFLEPLGQVLDNVDTSHIYGTVGVRTVREGSDVLWALNSNRDGTRLGLYGRPFSKPIEVLTTDCNCMIVHSDLVCKYGLRFDERLLFDFYTEDFEISSYERFGIKSMVLPIKNHHYSFGNIGKRFLQQRRYLYKKYTSASRVYRTTTRQLLGPMHDVARIRRINGILRKARILSRLGHFFWQVKYYRDAKKKTRILGIKIVSKVKY